jgi:hypothetical protein
MYRKAMQGISLYSYPSYYGLYSLFSKIRDKGKTVSAWKQGVGREREEVEGRGEQ